MGVTMLVREKSTAGSPVVRNLRPLLSLVLMTAVFTATILGLGWAVRVSLAALGEGSRLPAVLLGTLAMVLAVVVGVAGSLAVHQDRGVRRNRPFMAWIIARLAALVALNSVTTFLLYFIQDKYRIPAGEAAALVARLPVVVGGFVLAFGLVAGRLADRYDRRLLTALGALLGGLGVGVLVLGQAVNTLYVAAGVIGLSYVLFQVASWALGADIIPPERSGEFLGLQNLAGAGAGAIGAYIGGTIADHTGYVWMMVMFGGMFWLSAAATLFIRTESLRPYAGQTASGSG
jgi:predicted MFS family arabinose efflux permease